MAKRKVSAPSYEKEAFSYRSTPETQRLVKDVVGEDAYRRSYSPALRTIWQGQKEPVGKHAELALEDGASPSRTLAMLGRSHQSDRDLRAPHKATGRSISKR